MANTRTEAVAALVDRLGHVFREPALLERALTHSSAEQKASRPQGDYERLEFLGDRVLGLLTAQHIMVEWPAANESELNRHLQVLVDKPACARVAKRMDVGPALRMDGGETQAGLRKNDSVLADVMEALLAAIYLDGGIEAAKAVYDRAWSEELAKTPPSHAAANVKAALQEWAQKAGRPLPTYRIVSQTGSDHAPTFQVEVSIQGVEPLTAAGRSRQEAEKAAASAMLKREGVI